MFAKKLATVSLLMLPTFYNLRKSEAVIVMCTYELYDNNIYGCNLINQTILTDSDMDAETGKFSE